MIYPDKTEVSVGDHIWWNEGTCVGFVCTVVESEADQDSWGFDSPHILLSGCHPYEGEGAGYIAYSISDFEDEAIGKLSAREEKEFGRVLAQVRAEARLHQPFHISLDLSSHEDGVWVFSALEENQLKEFARIKRER